MANLLDRFNYQISGSGNKVFDISAKISPSGDFQKLKDLDVILSSWNAILLTPVGTYPFDPEFGSQLLNFIFEPADSQTSKNIENEIATKLARYDDRGTVLGITIKFLPDRKGFTVDILAEFQDLQGLVSATIDENIYFNFMRQS
jgi:phage baseplate assembly protein W